MVVAIVVMPLAALVLYLAPRQSADARPAARRASRQAAGAAGRRRHSSPASKRISPPTPRTGAAGNCSVRSMPGSVASRMPSAPFPTPSGFSARPPSAKPISARRSSAPTPECRHRRGPGRLRAGARARPGSDPPALLSRARARPGGQEGGGDRRLARRPAGRAGRSAMGRGRPGERLLEPAGTPPPGPTAEDVAAAANHVGAGPNGDDRGHGRLARREA